MIGFRPMQEPGGGFFMLRGIRQVGDVDMHGRI